jgi:hypothetical protein
MYGGTAVNNILPKRYQFYDYTFQLPDFDAYHPEAYELSKEAADLFANAGYVAEAKSGLHYNTFKVFVNNIPLLDLTHLPNELYERLSTDAIVREDLRYAPADFLRMSMYLELSRPKGDVGRWEKIYRRLSILNKVFPMKAEPCKALDPLPVNLYKTLYTTLVQEKVLFLGGYAFRVYTGQSSVPEFDVVSTTPLETCNKLLAKLDGAVLHTHAPIGQLVDTHYSLSVDGRDVVFVYTPVACHSYTETKDAHGNLVKMGTIDTLFSFYLAFYYAGRSYMDSARILCACKALFNAPRRNRFSTTCYGKQVRLSDLRRQRTVARKTLKKTSMRYKKMFLNYYP